MPKFLGTTAKLSGGRGVPGVVQYSFVLKIRSDAGSYGQMRILRCKQLKLKAGTK